MEVEETSRIADNILRYASMMTSKAHLSAVTVLAEDSRVNQLKER
jgi:hypothetical protein